MKVAIIIPAYNEASVIFNVIKKISAEIKKNKISADIIVIDDGSIDETAKTAKKAGATVVSHLLNSGAGSATSTGLDYALIHEYDIAITSDADGQHLSKDVVKGIEIMSISKIDLLIGSRLINPEGMSDVKKLGNKGLSFLTWVLFGVKSTDSQSGLRGYSKKAIRGLRWKSSGFEFCSEMIWRAKESGLIIDEFPISALYTEYSKSKGQNNWNAINIIKRLLKQRIVEMFE